MQPLALCPLEEDEPPRPVAAATTASAASQAQKVVDQQPITLEDSECNYLVLFFIMGVIILAITDAMKK
jgi:hypothetical protein